MSLSGFFSFVRFASGNKCDEYDVAWGLKRYLIIKKKKLAFAILPTAGIKAYFYLINQTHESSPSSTARQ